MSARISVDHHVQYGEPCIVGTEITVQNVLELVKEGVSFMEITGEHYPELTSDDIEACLTFGADVLSPE